MVFFLVVVVHVCNVVLRIDGSILVLVVVLVEGVRLVSFLLLVRGLPVTATDDTFMIVME